MRQLVVVVVVVVGGGGGGGGGGNVLEVESVFPLQSHPMGINRFCSVGVWPMLVTSFPGDYWPVPEWVFYDMGRAPHVSVRGIQFLCGGLETIRHYVA